MPKKPSDPDQHLPEASDNDAGKIAEAILNFVGQIPKTESQKSDTPIQAAQACANAAAAKSALASGTLALPPGPLGLLTILPELAVVWRFQSQMIADIAAIYGKEASLTREQMLYCLFKHSASHIVRHLAIQVGERILVRRVSLRAFQTLAKKVGVRVTQRIIGRGISRWIPFVGALGVGAYAYYDTGQVATTAMNFFSRNIDVEDAESD